MLLILAFFVVFAAFIALWLTQAHEAARMRGEDRVAAASQVVATNALWISEVARQALRRIDDTVGPSLQPRSGKVQDIREAVDSLPGQVKAYVVDAKGDTIYSTDPEVKPINITDRDYFAVLAAGRVVLPVGTDGEPAQQQADLRVQPPPGARRKIRAAPRSSPSTWRCWPACGPRWTSAPTRRSVWCATTACWWPATRLPTSRST